MTLWHCCCNRDNNSNSSCINNHYSYNCRKTCKQVRGISIVQFPKFLWILYQMWELLKASHESSSTSENLQSDSQISYEMENLILFQWINYLPFLSSKISNIFIAKCGQWKMMKLQRFDSTFQGARNTSSKEPRLIIYQGICSVFWNNVDSWLNPPTGRCCQILSAIFV